MNCNNNSFDNHNVEAYVCVYVCTYTPHDHYPMLSVCNNDEAPCNRFTYLALIQFIGMRCGHNYAAGEISASLIITRT